MLETRPVQYLGAISYGMYLFHVSAITFVKKSLPSLQSSAPIVFVLATLVTLVMASFSYRYFELAFLNLRERFGTAALPSVQN